MTTGANAGDTKVKSEDQPGDSLEAELTRVRAKRLTRAEKPQYLGNAEFEEEVCLMSCRAFPCWPWMLSVLQNCHHGVFAQLKESSILVEPDIPIYDLREAMKQVGYPVEPRVPLFDTLQVKLGMCMVSLERQSTSNANCRTGYVALHKGKQPCTAQTCVCMQPGALQCCCSRAT